ncbi:hypothetical protein KR054_005344, partial [Drosophila jambulina]
EKNMSQNVPPPNFEDYVVCPYNSTHRLMPSRLAIHLARCARNYPSLKLARCPFNATHLYLVVDMKAHVVNCPDRATMVDHVKLPSTESEPQKFFVDSTENWDDEPPAPTYKPKVHCDSAFIIRNLQGAPQAERREFREKERMRFKTLR